MNRIDHGTIVELLGQSHRVAISLYLPGHAAEGHEIRQDPVRFKNLLATAEAQIAATGMNSLELRDMLAPATDFLADEDNWIDGGAGWAFFIAPGLFRNYRLPVSVPENVQVGTSFHVKPLLPMLARAGHFYVLALSENHNRLILAREDEAHVIELPGAPANLNESMMLEDREESLQMHSTGSPHSGDGAGMFHGGGSWNDYEKAQMGKYMKEVGDALGTLLNTDGAPLVVAAPERVYSEFKSNCSYAGLIDQPVTGNYDDVDPGHLRDLAWPIAQPQLQDGGQQKLARMREVVGTPVGITDPKEIVEAAAQGRIDTLFLDAEAEVWGVFYDDNQRAVVHDHKKETSTDLVEIAAVKTIATRGLIQTLPATDIPGGQPLAALLRW